MLNAQTFFSDEELNQFFKSHTIGNNPTIYIIKLIILYNPVSNRQEQHLIYSDNQLMRSGQHMRKGSQ